VNLNQIQTELEHLKLWQMNAPSPEQLMSTLPFCMDTLTFTEWLQWIYIGRLRALIEAKQDLPKGAVVYPYAEETFKVDGQGSRQLLLLISELDQLLK
jgi:uncharacterized protein YqcC (DUF446 family)